MTDLNNLCWTLRRVLSCDCCLAEYNEIIETVLFNNNIYEKTIALECICEFDGEHICRGIDKLLSCGVSITIGAVQNAIKTRHPNMIRFLSERTKFHSIMISYLVANISNEYKLNECNEMIKPMIKNYCNQGIYGPPVVVWNTYLNDAVRNSIKHIHNTFAKYRNKVLKTDGINSLPRDIIGIIADYLK